MLGTYMINWSGQSIPTNEMMVMRRVAVLMHTVYGAKEVGFVHDVCAGIVRFQKTSIYVSIGGLFFFGDFGSKNNMPNTVDFFIPRAALHNRGDSGMMVAQRMRREGNEIVSEGYAEDVDTATGAGKLKITIRQHD